MNVNTILLRRVNKIAIPSVVAGGAAGTPFKPNIDIVATFNQNLQSLGYTLSPECFNVMTWLGNPQAFALMEHIITDLKELRGVRNYRPMYPNFPEHVMEASDAELYLNALTHYFSSWVVDVTGNPDNIWLPKYDKKTRKELDEKVQLTVIKLATRAEIDAMATAIMMSNTSISATDKSDLRTLLMLGYSDILEVLPRIPNKENLAIVGALLFETALNIEPYFKTATDVLRLATALSDGDVSLAADSTFRSFARRERIRLLHMLEQCGNLEEDMLRWKARWIRLGERLHPGDYAKRYPRSFAAFSALRSNERIITYRSNVEETVRNGDVVKAISLLSQRPGEFARRLDHLLRTATSEMAQNRIVMAFMGCASEVSTPVLLQVYTHFSYRNTSELRVVFPKGNVAKVRALENKLPELPFSITNQLSEGVAAVLRGRFSNLPSLGRVYVDHQLMGCLVPFSQRSASKSLRTLVRGSRLPFGGDKDTIRFFIHWHNTKEGGWDGRVDLDLSAVFYNENWEYMEHVSYTNLRLSGYKACHSGDITSAPDGACEFIDIDIPSAVKHGAQYVIMSINSFTGQAFDQIPECFAGWMLRENPNSGEVFEPKMVLDKVDVTMSSKVGVPMILDLVNRQVIWADAAVNVNGRSWGYNVENTSDTIQLMGKAFTSIRKPNLYDLLRLHAEGRGTLVDDPECADVVFSVENGTPFDLATIASEYMADSKRVTP
jgi:hypothetical protein